MVVSETMERRGWMLLVGRWRMVRQRKRQRIAAPVRVPRRDARRTRNRTVVMRQPTSTSTTTTVNRSPLSEYGVSTIMSNNTLYLAIHEESRMIRRAGSKTKMEEPWCRRTIRVQIGFSLYQSRIRSFSWQAPIYSCNRASKEIVKAHPALLRLRR